MWWKKYCSKACDKVHIWDVQYIEDVALPDNGFLKYGFSTLITNILAQGVSGYYYGCPDMVGGGLASDFSKESNIDYELLIRSCQCSTLLPMIQFSYALWNCKDERVRQCVKKCINIRDEFSSYIFELAKNASLTGEPIIRYMEYEFPNQNMEKVVEQFMLGDKFLVAPVLKKGEDTKKVVFPKNTKWQNYFTKEVFDCGEFVVPCDINTFLVFEKI